MLCHICIIVVKKSYPPPPPFLKEKKFPYIYKIPLLYIKDPLLYNIPICNFLHLWKTFLKIPRNGDLQMGIIIKPEMQPYNCSIIWVPKRTDFFLKLIARFMDIFCTHQAIFCQVYLLNKSCAIFCL